MRNARSRFFLACFALLSPACAHSKSVPSGPASIESCAIDPAAIVSDACASFSTLDRLNTQLHPSIKYLTQDSDFFSYYRLNLYKECPFWSDDAGVCGNIACAVNTIENEEDIPAIWRVDELSKLQGPKAKHPSRKLQRESKPLMGELGADVGESCVVEYDDDCDDRDYCIPEDESSTGKGDYVSLVDNPERFTGYSGPGAQQVWEVIYRENCFSHQDASPVRGQSGAVSSKKQASIDLRYVLQDSDDSDECLEKRVFYRIISGMHTSISAHLCYDYLNKSTAQWEPNVECYKDRLHDYPDRISNLYFNYALMLRALEKVRPALRSYTFCSGDAAQDAATKKKIFDLADKVAAGPRIYDESLMFADTSLATVGLKDDFRSRFRNVSRAMDCVGCDKCRLWGKLQTAGYGTALKILFEFDEKSTDNPPLRRTELVALVNTLEKVSSSLRALGHFEQLLDHSSTDAVLDEAPETRIKPKREKSVLRKQFEDEFGLVAKTTYWVLKRWAELPREMQVAP